MGVNSVYERMDLDMIFSSVTKKPTVYGGITPPAEIIKTELFLHQKKALHWLFDRETTQDLPAFWVEKVIEKGQEKIRFFINILTKYKSEKRPDPLRGGVFADDSGSGKKLTLVSLIALDQCSIPNTETDEAKEEPMDFEGFRQSSQETDFKSTLIICSQSSVSRWKYEITEHIELGTLKYYVYDGSEDVDIAELHSSHIVITTYSKFGSWETCKDDTNHIKGMKWWRIILEEDNVLKNQKSKIINAVNNLSAINRWIVTGKRMEDISTELLFSSVKFLKFYPFSSQSQWARMEMTKSNNRKQVLIALLSLRVTKKESHRGLPKKIISMCKVDLSDYERQLYDALEDKARNVQGKYKALSGSIMQLRQLSTHTQLLSSDQLASITRRHFKDVSEEPVLLKKLVEKLQEETDEFVCPICMSPPCQLSVTSCTHIFCENCMMESLRHSVSEHSPYLCPMCRRHLVKADLFSVTEQYIPEIIKANRTPSSKVVALLRLLEKSRRSRLSIKSVIFSEFDQVLRLIEKPINEAGFMTFRIEGGASKRNANMLKEFSVYGNAAVLLASPECTFSDLTMASMIYLMEPWCDANTEEKVINKVHRIGQTAAVEVMRLVASDTIEERVLLMRKSQGKLNKKETHLTRLRALLAL